MKSLFTATRKNGESGQLVVEYALLMLVVISLSSLVLSTIRGAGGTKAVAFHPFSILDGLIQCGVWQPCGMRAKTKDSHANASARVLSLDPGPR